MMIDLFQIMLAALIFAVLVLLFVEKKDKQGCLKMLAAIFLIGTVVDVAVNFMLWLNR